MSAGSGMMLAAWLQTGDIRDVSWWLPHNPAIRDAVWTAVIALNLAVLIWILYKLLFAGKGFSVPRVLRARGEEIATRMQAAEAAHQAATARLAEIEARIQNLPAELAALEREGRDEAAREYQRLVEAGQRDANHILKQGREEMEAAAKLAQKELKSLAAKLAVDLAAKRIREQLSPAQDEIVVANALEQIRSGRAN